MLYKFKSQAAADVVMLQLPAEELLKIIGKEPGKKGIITVEQAPAAIRALQTEINRREAMGEGLAVSANPEQDDEPEGASPSDAVTLRQRATPFITLLERSSAAGKDVVWGV
ncbi:MAG: DUF1840 domain-containing protein [Ottowia sp.]|nr:DUF1840 domain-containing protein [Ottowia sp.]